jgi:hypothetical protein
MGAHPARLTGIDSTLRAAVDTGAAGISIGTSSVRLQRRHFSSTPPTTTRASRLPHRQRQSPPVSSESTSRHVGFFGSISGDPGSGFIRAHVKMKIIFIFNMDLTA